MTTLYFLTKERNILKAYPESQGYTDMINILENKYCISSSTYRRRLPNICLELSQYIDYDQPPTVRKIIDKFKEREIENHG